MVTPEGFLHRSTNADKNYHQTTSTSDFDRTFLALPVESFLLCECQLIIRATGLVSSKYHSIDLALLNDIAFLIFSLSATCRIRSMINGADEQSNRNN